ncbi:hypothetical protein [Moorena sp. SIO3H5]|uniref:hypothetical protein n=1 Tax=Moorena sp. SIO3H5 TaxID=2607834 RepID=UPI0013B75206|nr:hypothetical protein [Moorena sp. SIO3H5]NEO74586.1 hypothetical protein [Moorena sp. SIO3H5]
MVSYPDCLTLEQVKSITKAVENYTLLENTTPMPKPKSKPIPKAKSIPIPKPKLVKRQNSST